MADDEPQKPVKVILAENGPKFQGNVQGSITARQWLESLETTFEVEEITDDGDKIKRARNEVNYDSGDARDIMMASVFTSYSELKKTILLYFDKGVATPTSDFEALKAISWPSSMSFPTFICRLTTLAENFENSGNFTVGTGFELAKATTLSIIKKHYSSDVLGKVENKATMKKCHTKPLLQEFLQGVFAIIHDQKRSDKLFPGEINVVDELDALYMGKQKNVSWTNKGSQGDFRKQDRYSNNSSRWEDRKGRNDRYYSPGSRQGSPSPRRNYGFHGHSRDGRRDRYEKGFSGSEGNRRPSRSPSAGPYECWNCGLEHNTSAEKCRYCLICGTEDHPTRLCKRRKLYHRAESKTSHTRFVDSELDKDFL